MSLARDSSPLPDFIPNTHPDEPSFPGNPVPFKGMKDVDNGTVPLPSNGSKDVVSKPPSPPSEEPAPPPRKVSGNQLLQMLLCIESMLP